LRQNQSFNYGVLHLVSLGLMTCLGLDVIYDVAYWRNRASSGTPDFNTCNFMAVYHASCKSYVSSNNGSFSYFARQISCVRANSLSVNKSRRK